MPKAQFAKSKPVDERAAKSARHDATFMLERKKQEALNLEKTMKLKALRLEKEALARATAPPAKKSASRAAAAAAAKD